MIGKWQHSYRWLPQQSPSELAQKSNFQCDYFGDTEVESFTVALLHSKPSLELEIRGEKGKYRQLWIIGYAAIYRKTVPNVL